MKLSEVVIDKNAVPSQQEMQIVNSIFDGVEKQKTIDEKQQSNKKTLLTAVVAGIMIAVILGLQPSLNNVLSKIRPIPSFIIIFVQAIFSMILFYLLLKHI